jgi:Tfp pilus assembly protein FimT
MRVPFRPASRQAGTTLAEMTVVVAVLAVAAAIAVPAADPAGPPRVDAVAGEVAQALRFAQREALRTKVWHVVRIDPPAQLRVYRLNTSGAIAEDTSRPVLHPLDKLAYQVSFAGGSAAGAQIASAVFRYQQGAIRNYASFGPDGSPADIHGWLLTDIDPLSDGAVTVRYGNVERIVRLAPVTGRVTL